jgi:hypothetical protein
MAENDNDKKARELYDKIVSSVQVAQKGKIKINLKLVLLVIVYVVLLFGSSVRQFVTGGFDLAYMGSAEYWSSVFSDTATNLIILFVMFIYALDSRKRKSVNYNTDKDTLEREIREELESESFDACMLSINDKRIEKHRKPIAYSFVTNGYSPKQKTDDYDPYAIEPSFFKFLRDIGPRVAMTFGATVGFRAIVLDLADAVDWKTAVVAILFTLIPMVGNAYIGISYSQQWLDEKTFVDMRKRMDIWSLYKNYKKTWKKEVPETCQTTNIISQPITTVNLSKNTLGMQTPQYNNNEELLLVR